MIKYMCQQPTLSWCSYTFFLEIFDAAPIMSLNYYVNINDWIVCLFDTDIVV